MSVHIREQLHEPGLPVAARLSLWLGAVLRGSAAPDDLVARLVEDAPVHVVHGLGPEPLPLLAAVGPLRRIGARGCSVALPEPGDLVGLAGPSGFNEAALEAGQAVVVTGAALGLVPQQVGRALEWTARDAVASPPLDPAEEGRMLRRTLTEVTAELVALDVARWQPEIADALLNARHRPATALPSDVPPRVAETLDRALLCREIVALALESDGGAVSSYEMERRRQALLPLARAARHAVVAACSG